MRYFWRDQSGITLIELIMAIVIISIGIGGILTVYLTTIRSSTDPMIERQAISIAEAYLEEILSKAFTDPDGVSGETDRSQYDDIADYTNLPPDNLVRNQFGAEVAGLEPYRAIVAISSTTVGVPAVTAWRVEVDVTHPAAAGVSLVGYRTEY